MRNDIEKYVINEAKFIIKTKGTIRSTAKAFGISRSTVHEDFTLRLPKINPVLYEKVKEVLMINKEERHIRGGMATKNRTKVGDNR